MSAVAGFPLYFLLVWGRVFPTIGDTQSIIAGPTKVEHKKGFWVKASFIFVSRDT